MPSFHRRRFLLTTASLASTAWMLGPRSLSARAAHERDARASGIRGLKADVVIIGGGLGGCAAALAALRSGLRVILTEETDWIGGQLTSQAVPPDENRWIELHHRGVQRGEASAPEAISAALKKGGLTALPPKPRAPLVVHDKASTRIHRRG